jgi:hypothetical protein
MTRTKDSRTTAPLHQVLKRTSGPNDTKQNMTGEKTENGNTNAGPREMWPGFKGTQDQLADYLASQPAKSR